jgi:signal transduction histidine kinase
MNQETRTIKPAVKTPKEVRWAFWIFYAVCHFILVSNYGYTIVVVTANRFYLIPTTAALILFTIYPFFDYKPQNEFTQSPPYWGGKRWRRLAFIIVSFLLIFWASQLTLTRIENNDTTVYAATFSGVYTSVLILTVLLLNWRIALPLCAVQIFINSLQTVLQNPNFDIFDLPWTTLAYGLIIGFTWAITALLVSRVESEVLVQELRATKQRLEQALEKEREVAVLKERNRMAREMHDVLGHALVLVSIKLEAAELLQNINPAQATQEIRATKEMVRQTMADLRGSLAELRSTGSDTPNKPLQSALEEWATNTAKQGDFAITFSFDTDGTNLPVAVQDTLWRIGQEAMLNVLKHARATKATLKLYHKAGKINLEVTDNGIGIPHLSDGTANLETAGHYGVRGMRERLEAVGGDLSFTTNYDGFGTRLIAAIPLEYEENSAQWRMLPQTTAPAPPHLSSIT